MALKLMNLNLKLDWESLHKVFYGLFCPINRGTVLNVHGGRIPNFFGITVKSRLGQICSCCFWHNICCCCPCKSFILLFLLIFLQSSVFRPYKLYCRERSKKKRQILQSRLLRRVKARRRNLTRRGGRGLTYANFRF